MLETLFGLRTTVQSPSIVKLISLVVLLVDNVRRSTDICSQLERGRKNRLVSSFTVRETWRTFADKFAILEEHVVSGDERHSKSIRARGVIRQFFVLCDVVNRIEDYTEAFSEDRNRIRIAGMVDVRYLGIKTYTCLPESMRYVEKA